MSLFRDGDSMHDKPYPSNFRLLEEVPRESQHAERRLPLGDERHVGKSLCTTIGGRAPAVKDDRSIDDQRSQNTEDQRSRKPRQSKVTAARAQEKKAWMNTFNRCSNNEVKTFMTRPSHDLSLDHESSRADPGTDPRQNLKPFLN